MNLNDFQSLCENAYCRVCYEPFESLNIVQRENLDPSELVKALLNLFDKSNMFDKGKMIAFCRYCQVAVHRNCYEPEQLFPIEVQISKTEKIQLQYFECDPCLAKQNKTLDSEIKCYFCEMSIGLLIPLKINQKTGLEPTEEGRRSKKNSFIDHSAAKEQVRPTDKNSVVLRERKSSFTHSSLDEVARLSSQVSPLEDNTQNLYEEEIPMQLEEEPDEIVDADLQSEDDSYGLRHKRDALESEYKNSSSSEGLFCHPVCGFFNQGTYLKKNEVEINSSSLAKKVDENQSCNFCNVPLKSSFATCSERFCNVKVHLICLLEERTQYMVSNKIDRNSPILWNAILSYVYIPLQEIEDTSTKEKTRTAPHSSHKRSKLAFSKNEKFRPEYLIPNCDSQTSQTLSSLYDCLRDIGLIKFDQLNSEFASIIRQVGDNFKLSLKFVSCLSLLCERHKQVFEPCVCGEVQKSPQLIQCENCFNWVHIDCELERGAEIHHFACSKCKMLALLEDHEFSSGHSSQDFLIELIGFLKKCNLSIYEHLKLSNFFSQKLAFKTRSQPLSVDFLEQFSEIRSNDFKTQSVLVNEVILLVFEKNYVRLLGKVSKIAEKNVSKSKLIKIVSKVEDQKTRINQLISKFSKFGVGRSCEAKRQDLESLANDILTLSSSDSDHVQLLFAVYKLASDHPGLSTEFHSAANRCLNFYKGFVEFLKREFEERNRNLEEFPDRTKFLVDNKIQLLLFFKQHKEVLNNNFLIQKVLPSFLDHYQIITKDLIEAHLQIELQQTEKQSQSLVPNSKKNSAKTFYMKLMRAFAERMIKDQRVESGKVIGAKPFKEQLNEVSKQFFEHYQTTKTASATFSRLNLEKYERFVYKASKIISSSILSKKFSLKEIRQQWEEGWVMTLEAVEKFLKENEEFSEAGLFIKLKYLSHNSRALFKEYSAFSDAKTTNAEHELQIGGKPNTHFTKVVLEVLQSHGFLHSELIYRLIVHNGVEYLNRYLSGKESSLKKIVGLLNELNNDSNGPKSAQIQATPDFNVHEATNQTQNEYNYLGTPERGMEVQNNYQQEASEQMSKSHNDSSSSSPVTRGKSHLDLHHYLNQEQHLIIQQASQKIKTDLEAMKHAQKVISSAIRSNSNDPANDAVTIEHLQEALVCLSQVSLKEFADQTTALLGIDKLIVAFDRMIPSGITSTSWTLKEVIKLSLKSKNFIEEFVRQNKFKVVMECLSFLSLFDDRCDVIEEAFTRLARYYVEERLRKSDINGLISLERVCDALFVFEQIKDSGFKGYIQEKRMVISVVKFLTLFEKVLTLPDNKLIWFSFFNDFELAKAFIEFKRGCVGIMSWRSGMLHKGVDGNEFHEQLTLIDENFSNAEEACLKMLNQLDLLDKSLQCFEQTERVSAFNKKIHKIKRNFLLIYKFICLRTTHLSKNHIKFEIEFDVLANDIRKIKQLRLNPKNRLVQESVEFAKRLVDYYEELQRVLPHLNNSKKPRTEMLLLISLSSQSQEFITSLETLEDLKRRGGDIQNFVYNDYQILKMAIADIKELESDVLTEIRILQKKISALMSMDRAKEKVALDVAGMSRTFAENPDKTSDVVSDNYKLFFIQQEKHKPKAIMDLAKHESRYNSFRKLFFKLNSSSRALRERLIQHEFLYFAIKFLVSPKTLKDLTIFTSIKMKQILRSANSDLEAFECLSATVRYMNCLVGRCDEEIDTQEVEEFAEYEFCILLNDFCDLLEKPRRRLMALQSLSFLLKGLKKKPCVLSAMDYKCALECFFATECQISRELENIILRAIKRETRLVKLKSRLFGPPKYPYAARYLLDKYTELLEFDQEDLEELARKFLVQADKYLSIRFRLLRDPKFPPIQGASIDYDNFWYAFESKGSVSLEYTVLNQLEQMKNILRFAINCEQNACGSLNDINQTLRFIAQGGEPWKSHKSDLKQGLPERLMLVRLTSETLMPSENQQVEVTNVSPDFVLMFSELKALDIIDPLLILVSQIQIVLQAALVLAKEKIIIKIGDLRFLILKISEIKAQFTKSEFPVDICVKANDLLYPCWMLFLDIFKETQEYLKSLTNQSYEFNSMSFKYQSILNLNDALSQIDQFKDEKIDTKVMFDKSASTYLDFSSLSDISKVTNLLIEFEKICFCENDKKYKDKKDRYNLNLKDVKTDFRAIVAEDVARFKAQLLSHHEQKLHLTEINPVHSKAKQLKKVPETLRHADDGRKNKNQRDEPVNPEFSPIVSETNSVNLERPIERVGYQPKNLFRNLISENRDSKMKTMATNDVIDLVLEEGQDENDQKQENSHQEARSTVSNRESYSIRGIGNIYSMLGQLRLWQLIKKNVQENRRYKREEGSESLTAFSKKVESNYTNLKIFYPQITDFDIAEFLKHYKYINALIRLYVSEKVTYANLIDLVQNPTKKLRESSKRHTKSNNPDVTMLNELFEEYDNEGQSEAKRLKTKPIQQEVADIYEPHLVKSNNRGQQITSDEESTKKHDSQYGTGDLFKRIKMATAAASDKSSIHRLHFPKNNRIIFISDEGKLSETIIDQLEFLTSESQSILETFPSIERPPKIRLNQFKKPVSELEREFRTQDSIKPNIIIGAVELDSSKLNSGFSSSLQQKIVWGYACSPNLHFYVCHLSAVSNHTFEKLESSLDSPFFSQRDFANVFVYFLKKISGQDKSGGMLRFIPVYEDTEVVPPGAPQTSRSAIDKFNALLRIHQNQKWNIPNAIQPEVEPNSYTFQQELPKSLLNEFNPLNPPLVANPTGESITSKNNSMIPPMYLLDSTKQHLPPFNVSQGVSFGHADFGMPHSQSNLLNDLRQSNQSGQTTTDVTIPQPFFVNQQQSPFMFPPGLPLPIPPFGGLQNIPPMIPGQFMGMPFFNPLAMNLASLIGPNQPTIPLMTQGFNPNDLPLVSHSTIGSTPSNQIPSKRHDFESAPIYGGDKNDKYDREAVQRPPMQRQFDFTQSSDLSNAFPISLSNEPINGLTSMTFNFENANEENEDLEEKVKPDMAHSQTAPVVTLKDSIPRLESVASARPADEEDQELIELVRDNDSETLADCYLDADDTLRQLLLATIQQYAPEKINSVIQLIQHK